MNKFIVFGLVLTVVVSLASAKMVGPFYGKQEPECLSQGGLCMVDSQCLSPIGQQGVLCHQKGFQCCSGFPKDETHCKAHGGECFKKGYCNQQIVYREASDCTDEQECCILL